MHDSTGMQELLKHFHENRFSHAFLLETNHQEQCLKNLLEFLAYINRTGDDEEDNKLVSLIKGEALPSLIVIRPDGQNIKKDQILELKHFFQTKPTFSKYNMYVLLNAETLNSSSANTMLKFLEEPEENILGFFITNNKENIIDTIKSRCQIVLDYYEGTSLFSVPKVWQSIAINYIKEFECAHEETLLYNKNVIFPLLQEKKDCFYLFQCIFQIYEALFQSKISNKSLQEEYLSLEFLLKKDENYFFQQMKYLVCLMNDMNYNLNIQMLLDRFVLESR